MAGHRKRIAVVGGGVSRINSIASLKEEGFDPVCFEYYDRPGGTWYYKTTSEEGFASLMPSSEHSEHSELLEYITEYAVHKDVLRHTRCDSEVIGVPRAEDYPENGQWEVTVRNRVTRDVASDVFDGVLNCVGHTNRPKMTTYPWVDVFWVVCDIEGLG